MLGESRSIFCLAKYKMQVNNGLHVLQEHPRGASSWKLDSVQEVIELPGFALYQGDLCQYGMRQVEGGETHWAKKTTTFMTHSEFVGRRMEGRCQGLRRHLVLVGGRATAAGIYPDECCVEILRCAKEQLILDGRMQRMGIGAVFAREQDEMDPGEEEGDRMDGGEFWDEQSGEQLNQEMVRKAREEEMEEAKKHQVWIKVSISRCWEVTGKGPIGTRWIDMNKGDVQNLEYRSRLVAKEINTHKREDLFAATPPLEAMKLLIASMTEGIGYARGGREMP
jgi:hypothetical protein